jgi:transcriptional regulator with XRE-family HTH domain
METLREFITSQIKRLGVSTLKFARMVGVSHTTINNLISDQPGKPTVELLWKLSRATDTELFTLLMLAYPDLIRNGLSADARIVGERYSKAPPETKHMVSRLLDE